MIPLVQLPELVNQYGPEFSDLFSPGQYGQFERYLSGLLVSPNQTVEAINRLFVLQAQHQSTLNRFLTSSDYSIDRVNQRRLAWLQDCSQTRFKMSGPARSGVLIIDDSLLKHVGKHFEHIALLYDHVDEHYVWAHNVVSFHYSDDQVDYPIESQLWKPVDLDQLEAALVANGISLRPRPADLKQSDPKKWRSYLVRLANQHQDQPAIRQVYRSKLSMAQDLLSTFFERYPDVKLPVVFDSWYCTPWFCRWLDRHLGAAYVGRIKLEEEVFRQAHQFCSVGDLAQELKKQHLADPEKAIFKPLSISFKGKQKTYYCYSKVHRLRSFGRHRLLINYRQADLEDTPCICICNRTKWEAKTISRIYRHRWPVEVYHQEAKAEGLQAYQLRQFKAIQRHVAFIALAYSMLQRARFDTTLVRKLQDSLDQEIQGSLAFWRRILQAQAMMAIFQWMSQALLQGKEVTDLFTTITKAIAYSA